MATTTSLGSMADLQRSLAQQQLHAGQAVKVDKSALQGWASQMGTTATLNADTFNRGIRLTDTPIEIVAFPAGTGGCSYMKKAIEEGLKGVDALRYRTAKWLRTTRTG